MQITIKRSGIRIDRYIKKKTMVVMFNVIIVTWCNYSAVSFSGNNGISQDMMISGSTHYWFNGFGLKYGISPDLSFNDRKMREVGIVVFLY